MSSRARILVLSVPARHLLCSATLAAALTPRHPASGRARPQCWSDRSGKTAGPLYQHVAGWEKKQTKGSGLIGQTTLLTKVEWNMPAERECNFLSLKIVTDEQTNPHTDKLMY